MYVGIFCAVVARIRRLRKSLQYLLAILQAKNDCLRKPPRFPAKRSFHEKCTDKCPFHEKCAINSTKNAQTNVHSTLSEASTTNARSIPRKMRDSLLSEASTKKSWLAKFPNLAWRRKARARTVRSKFWSHFRHLVTQGIAKSWRHPRSKRSVSLVTLLAVCVAVDLLRFDCVFLSFVARVANHMDASKIIDEPRFDNVAILLVLSSLLSSL